MTPKEKEDMMPFEVSRYNTSITRHDTIWYGNLTVNNNYNIVVRYD